MPRICQLFACQTLTLILFLCSTLTLELFLRQALTFTSFFLLAEGTAASFFGALGLDAFQLGAGSCLVSGCALCSATGHTRMIHRAPTKSMSRTCRTRRVSIKVL